MHRTIALSYCCNTYKVFDFTKSVTSVHRLYWISSFTWEALYYEKMMMQLQTSEASSAFEGSECYYEGKYSNIKS